MAKPTKSACACAPDAFASHHCGCAAASAAVQTAGGGVGAPNTLVMSPVGPVPVFSSTMLAPATAPTSQPARVYGTQGAGAFIPLGVIILGTVGVPVAATVSVQYPNELGKEKKPDPLAVRT